ncbi:MAG TPA: radical SAM protein, partial [Porphyromonadaceae bacterium]|nr:radical SAM protein [Porphyromonadaceae bacterium]
NVIQENVDYCVELIKQNPHWGLSLQVHKLIGIR